MKIDVVMPTYNSNKWHFKYVLKRLRNEFNVNKFIVIDKFSNDGSDRIIREYFPEAVIVRTRANLAYARYIGIKLVETEWFLFNDDDAIVLPGASRLAERFMRIKKVGALELGTFGLNPTNKVLINKVYVDKTPTLLLKRKTSNLTWNEVVKNGIIYLTRGFTFSTLIRTEAVMDYVPNPYMGAFEDYDITQHIINRGYAWILIDQPLVLHVGWYTNSYLRGIKVQMTKALWHGSSVKYANIPRKFLFIHSISRIFSSTMKMIANKEIGDVYYLIWHLVLIPSMFQNKYVEINR